MRHTAHLLTDPGHTHRAVDQLTGTTPPAPLVTALAGRTDTGRLAFTVTLDAVDLRHALHAAVDLVSEWAMTAGVPFLIEAYGVEGAPVTVERFATL